MKKAIFILVLLLTTVAQGQWTIGSRSFAPVAGSSPSFSCPVSGSCYDNFSGTPGVALLTYNPAWQNGDYSANGPLQLAAGNVVIGSITSTSYMGAYYSTSTSDTSQIIFKAVTDGSSPQKSVNIRYSAHTTGYGVGYSSTTGTSVALGIYRLSFTAYIGEVSGCSINTSVDNLIKLSGNNTSSPVVLTVYVNGVQCGTFTDSSNWYLRSDGFTYPGFVLGTGSTQAGSAVAAWQDH